MIYNKLVRDKIPDMIASKGEKAIIRTLDDAEYLESLEKKLDEKVSEYHSDKNIEELADILEVVFALAEGLGHTRTELMDVYQKKHDDRGGFSGHYFLVSKEG